MRRGRAARLTAPSPYNPPMALARPLRFCHVTTFFPPENFGGDGIFLLRLVRELAARGHHVEVVHDAGAYHLLHPAPAPPAPPLPESVVVHRLRSRFGPLAPLVTHQTGLPGLKARRLRAILDGGRFDVVHFHNVSLVGGPGVLRLGPPSAVRLYTTHEHWLVCPMHVLWRYGREVCPAKECLRCQIHGMRPPQWWRYTRLLPRALREIDAFIAPSRFTMRRHLEELDLPFTNIPYFLPRDPAREAAVAPRAHPRPYFLFVGRLEKIKGLQTLVPVFREHAAADLLVAGEGEYGSALRRIAGGVPSVRFLGRLPYEELRALYRGAVAAIVPSLCVEVFGIVILEAYAHGTPVIVRRLGALPDVVEESGGGFVYETDEELRRAMDALLADPTLREALGEKGRQAYLERWTEEAHVRQYLSLVRDVADKKGAREVASAAEEALGAAATTSTSSASAG